MEHRELQPGDGGPMDEVPSRTTRRSFLGSVVATSAAVAIGEGLASSGDLAGAATLPATKTLRESAFRRALGTTFDVKAGMLHYRVKLASVESLSMSNLPYHRAAGHRTTGEQYSLMFTGSSSRTFAQGTYRVTHHQLGTFALFLVPVGRRHGAQAYQAVIVNV